jgi:hypothetical protein
MEIMEKNDKKKQNNLKSPLFELFERLDAAKNIIPAKDIKHTNLIVKFKTVSLVCMITFSIITGLSGASVLFYVAKQLDDNYHIHNPELTALFGLVIGIPLYALMVQIIKLFFSQDVSMEFNPEYLNVRSGNNNKVIKYTEIKNYIIWNNTDYAKIIVETDTGKHILHAGLSTFNLLAWRNKNRFKIIDSFDEIDTYFKDFEKIICVKKGKEIVRYENKKLKRWTYY